MKADWSAATEGTLRVDGGMSASDWAMQFLSDIIGAPVDRPRVLETTALGAAWLAGMRAGVYPDQAGFAATSLLLAAPLGAGAQTLELFYNEPLEGVYSQDWAGRVIGADPASGVLVYLRGSGKSGDFHGVLSVDCETPSRSAWVAQGGYLAPDDVPTPTINVMRAEACGSP